jgi:hypothetical protein
MEIAYTHSVTKQIALTMDFQQKKEVNNLLQCIKPNP